MRHPSSRNLCTSKERKPGSPFATHCPSNARIQWLWIGSYSESAEISSIGESDPDVAVRGSEALAFGEVEGEVGEEIGELGLVYGEVGLRGEVEL